MIPEFYRPPAHLINPHTEQGGNEAIDWLWRLGIITAEADEARIRGYQINYWGGLTAHDVPLERFIPYCKLCYYFTLADDHLEGADSPGIVRQFRRQIIDVIESEPTTRPMVGLSPWVHAFADIWPQITDNLSKRTKNRFARFYLDSLACIELEIRHRINGTTPTLAQYLPMRFNTVGMNYATLAGQNALMLAIPDELAEHYLMAEVLRCGSDLVGWANDLESYQKEVPLGQKCNLIPVVAASERCSIEQAANRAEQWIRERQVDLLGIEKVFPGLVDDLSLSRAAASAAARLIDFIKSAFFAFALFSDVSGRYQDVSERSDLSMIVQNLRDLYNDPRSSVDAPSM